jgi:hypothetical protein
MAYLYRHIRLDKNEPFYIGIGSDETYKRANWKFRNNKLWNSVINKTNYEVEIMIDNLTWNDACEKEKEFILLYGRKDLKTGILVNLTSGGDGKVGNIVSNETREKLSIALKGKKRPKEIIEKIRLKNIGKKRSEEIKLKLSNSHKGIKTFGIIKSDETRRKLSLANKGKKRKPLSEETKIKIGNANKLKKHYPLSDETKKKLSEALKIYWANKNQ